MRLLVKVGILFCSIILSVFACSFIAEHYFFDKFFYQKSVKYGYKEDTSFSERTRDLYQYGFISQNSFIFPESNNQVLGASSDKYTIAIVGDSFVWGSGVKEKDRFAPQLKEQLQDTHVEVLSLGYPQDGFLDHLAKIEGIKKQTYVDLYIIPVVINDALLTAGLNRYHSAAAQEIIETCKAQFPDQTVLTYPDWAFVGEETFQQVSDQLGRDTFSSITNSVNQCIAEMAILKIQSLTNQRVIFFITDDYFNDTPWQDMINLVVRNNVYMVHSERSKEIEKYKKYWQDPKKYFMVSQSEGHPSRLAYEMYAALIAQELQENKVWSYTSNK
jgi:lysophospholipase L1-like esterase